MNCATHNDVAAVAFCRTCGKPLCNQCTRDVRGVIYCESCLAARMEGAVPAAGFVPPPAQTVYPPMGAAASSGVRPPVSTGPNPAVAGILAGFFPFGVGAVYCSQYAKGLAHLVIMLLLIIGVSSDVPWYMHTILGIGIGFFYVYQIIDAVRSAKAIQEGEPAPDPFGLAAAFGAGEKIEGTKVPAGAAILIGLGILFLLHTAGLFEVGMGVLVSLTLILLGVWLFAKHWGLLGTSRAVCMCEQCRTRRLMGPAMLVTIGVLFLLDSVSRIEFGKTWPAILLVIGVVKLFQSNASTAGHIGPLPRGSAGYPPTAPPPGVESTVPSSEPPSSGEVKNV
ncbi:MAG TPA: B-box zinc finger protein [Candidatus Sulfotelmatobacter sp.]|nr:B-box zinc finger protein [Candidatus Sulfotelmatobacter sp.]